MTTPDKRHVRTVGTLLLAGALGLNLSACSNDTNDDPNPEPSASAAATETSESNDVEPTTPGGATYDTEWDIDSTVDDEAALRSFTPEEVDAAVTTVSDTTTTYSFNEAILRDTTPTAAELSGVTRYMTPQCGAGWRALTDRYTSGASTYQDKVNVGLIAFPNINEQGYRVQRSGPAAINLRINNVVAATEIIDDVTYMTVTETVAADVRLSHNGENRLSHNKKIVTFYMRAVNDHGRQVWKIDGYSGRYPAAAQTSGPEA